MKRMLALLFLLSLLTSCTLENDYYDNGYYYRPPPRARVEVPYGYSYRSAPQTHYHGSERPVVYSHFSQHGHRHVVPRHRNRIQRKDLNTHGHANTDVGAHEHRNNTATHGHDKQNAKSHGHDNQVANNLHGHD
ncbi:hypothetical protein [Legionella brunensis]|uniref:Lipoprotein n=1 Tax=Legionella brunensis TaxID=29422 RepID=A0A0W0SSS1_9GAMM|nr:hypothetical protein [Legionella brunensis]KTC86305.1 hypothetical protein Lbru_0799 [Legionella brunensis]